jgi:hypothetical protein
LGIGKSIQQVSVKKNKEVRMAKMFKVVVPHLVKMGIRLPEELKRAIWIKARDEQIRPSDLIRRILAAVVMGDGNRKPEGKHVGATKD